MAQFEFVHESTMGQTDGSRLHKATCPQLGIVKWDWSSADGRDEETWFSIDRDESDARFPTLEKARKAQWSMQATGLKSAKAAIRKASR